MCEALTLQGNSSADAGPSLARGCSDALRADGTRCGCSRYSKTLMPRPPLRHAAADGDVPQPRTSCTLGLLSNRAQDHICTFAHLISHPMLKLLVKGKPHCVKFISWLGVRSLWVCWSLAEQGLHPNDEGICRNLVSEVGFNMGGLQVLEKQSKWA